LAFTPKPSSNNTNIFIPTRESHGQNPAGTHFPKEEKPFLAMRAVFPVIQKNPLVITKCPRGIREGDIVVCPVYPVLVAIPNE
jgi:hypothetical protein